MRIKGWKKDTHWEQLNDIYMSRISGGYWLVVGKQSKYGHNILEKSKPLEYVGVFVELRMLRGGKKFRKHFSTKNKAIKFAVNWMKRHPRGV